MICKICGSEFDNALAVCPVCNTPSGVAPQVPQQPAQPVYRQPVQPNYQPPVQPNYQQQAYQQPIYQQGYAQAGMPPFASPVEQYIQQAGSINTMSVAGLVLAIFCGLVGLILSLVSGSKIKNLPYVQPEMLDPTSMVAYQEAQKKVQTAKTLNTITLVVFILNIVIGFVSGFISGFVGAL